MKRNLLAIFAVALALVASSFTVKKAVDVFLLYKITTLPPQSLITSYTQQTINPGVVPGTARLAWIKVSDNNGTVTQPEFNTAFSFLDLTPNGTLDDEAEIPGILEKRN